jgi:hypothetical protein
MFDRCEKWQDHVGQGCYPDCDMLPLGRVGKCFGEERDTLFTREEQKTMMSLWCIFGSPLMLGAEMTLLDDWTLSLLQNEELLRLESGDFVSRQVMRSRDECVWAAVDPNTGEQYVALFNLTNEPKEMAVSMDACASMFPEGKFTITCGEMKEVWSGAICAITDAVIRGKVMPHGVALYHGK